jgi:hypothetical protein
MTTTHFGIRKNAIIRVEAVKENDHNALWHSKRNAIIRVVAVKKNDHNALWHSKKCHYSRRGC